MNLDDNTIIQDIKIQDQPTGLQRAITQWCYQRPYPTVLGAAGTDSLGRWQLTLALKASGDHRWRSSPSPFD
eukprot:2144219-Pyramimonas_sp.AAC.1